MWPRGRPDNEYERMEGFTRPSAAFRLDWYGLYGLPSTAALPDVGGGILSMQAIPQARYGADLVSLSLEATLLYSSVIT